MKKVILFLLLAFIHFANAQEVRGNNGATLGYIKADGEVRGNNGSTLGYFKPDGEVRGNNGTTLGYIKSDGEIRGNNGSTLGYVKPDGEVRGNNGATLGYVKPDGEIRGQNGATICYVKNTDQNWAAAAVFSSFSIRKISRNNTIPSSNLVMFLLLLIGNFIRQQIKTSCLKAQPLSSLKKKSGSLQERKSLPFPEIRKSTSIGSTIK